MRVSGEVIVCFNLRTHFLRKEVMVTQLGTCYVRLWWAGGTASSILYAVTPLNGKIYNNVDEGESLTNGTYISHTW